MMHGDEDRRNPGRQAAAARIIWYSIAPREYTSALSVTLPVPRHCSGDMYVGEVPRMAPVVVF